MNWFNKNESYPTDDASNISELTKRVRDLTKKLQTSSYDHAQEELEQALYNLTYEITTGKYSRIFKAEYSKITLNTDSPANEFYKMLYNENFKPYFDSFIEAEMHDANIKISKLETKCENITSENTKLKIKIQEIQGYSDGLKLALRDAKHQ